MKFVIDYAMSMLGVPYKWAGNNPVEGLDCSGFVQCVLSSAGIDPPGDQSAQGLYDFFEKTGTHGAPSAGALVFYGESVKKITHIAFCIDQYRVIEAGGGDSKTHSKEYAAFRGAYVRIRLIDHRSDRVAIIKPSYAKIGVL